jgi:hypothetical protein
MQEAWLKLINQFKKNGYTPSEVQRIVHFYDLMIETDKKLKKLYKDEEVERSN